MAIKRRQRSGSTRAKTRRDFLKISAGVAAGGHILGPSASAQERLRVTIVMDAGDNELQGPAVKWATGQLQEALKAKGATVQTHAGLQGVPASDELIVVARPGSAMAGSILDAAGISASRAAEAVALARGRAANRPALLVAGADQRGAVYGLLEVADNVAHAAVAGAALRRTRNIAETAANPVRSVTRYFETDVEDKAWYYDKAFWRGVSFDAGDAAIQPLQHGLRVGVQPAAGRA